MPTPIFSAVGGLPMPLLPIDEQGEERVPDGDAVLSLDQAAAKFRATEESLRLLYCSHWDQIVVACGTAASAAATIREAAELAGLHQAFYPKLSKGEFARLVAFCRARKLDPRLRWVYPVWNPDPGDKQGGAVLEFRLRIDAMRAIALRTGQLACVEGGEYVYADDEHRPYRVSVTVRRLVAGREVAFTARADWDEHWPGYDEWWERRPCSMLEKCAEAKALRKAFPEELADSYSIDESMVADRPARAATSGVSGDFDPHRKKPWPRTMFEFELALVDCQLKDEARRRQVVTKLRKEFAGSYRTEPAFFRKALLAIYAEPASYGAAMPEGDAG